MARLLLLALLLASPARGEVIFDDTLGAPGTAPPEGTYDYAIRPDRGEARGGNLFFSFSEFWIHDGQEAGLLGEGFDNVVMRVPNERAHIGGTLTSEITGADIFLLAPRGIHYGTGAVVNVPDGSLTLSTADSLEFDDGGRFHSHGPPWPNEDLCCDGAPEKLQFDSVDHSEEIPQIAPQHEIVETVEILFEADLRVAAGRVTLLESLLSSSEGGTIYIAATGRAPATVPLSADLDPTWLEHVGEEAQIEIASGELNAIGTNVGELRGRVVLRGGDLVVTDGSNITAAGNYEQGTLDLRAAHSLEVSGASALRAFNLSTDLPAIYFNAPQVKIEGLGDTLTLLRSAGGAPIKIVAESSLEVSAATVFANGGNISIHAGRLDLSEKAKILTASKGEIDIQVAGSLNAREEATILSQPLNSEDAGDIHIRAGQLQLESGAQIRSFSDSNQNAGNIYVTVTNAASISGAVTVGEESIVSSAILTRAGESNTDPESQGSAGNIELDVGSLEVTGGALVSSRAYRSRDAGSIDINADGDVSVSGEFGLRQTQISAENFDGNPGNIEVNARSVSIRDRAVLSASSSGSAPGGSIEVNVQQNFLLADDAGVTADSLRSLVGGDIDIAAGGWIVLQDGRIETNVFRGEGTGGNIRIGIAKDDIPTPRLAVLNDDSRVTANAQAGAGGNIELRADTLLLSPDSVLDASSELGVDGSLDVAAPVVQVAGRLDPLPASFLDVRALLRAHCAQRAAEGGSSFVIEEGPPPPPSPRGYLGSPPRSPSSAQSPEIETVPSMSRQLERFDPGCGRDLQLAHAP